MGKINRDESHTELDMDKIEEIIDKILDIYDSEIEKNTDPMIIALAINMSISHILDNAKTIIHTKIDGN